MPGDVACHVCKCELDEFNGSEFELNRNEVIPNEIEFEMKLNSVPRAEYLDWIAFSPMPKIERFQKLNCSAQAVEIFEQLAWYHTKQ